MKRLKLILSIILISLMIIKILSSCSFAMTTEDLEQFIKQGKIAYDSTHGTSATDTFDYFNDLINSNFWASYKSSLNLSSYDSVLVRGYVSSSSPYLTMVNLCFFNNTDKNIQISSTGTSDGTGQNVGYIRAVNNNEISLSRYTFQSTTRNGTEYQFFSNDSFNLSTSTTAFLTNQCLLFYTGNIINQNNILYYGYNILNKIEASSIFNFKGLTKVADIRIGDFYNAYNISYRLYALNQNSKDYKAIEYRQLLDSGETLQGRTGELELINIFNKTNSDFCYIEMLDENNNIICTSNRFTITMSDSGGSSSYAPTYNSSGEQTGSIDVSGIIFSIDSQTNIIYSGDQQILNEIKSLESGENLRFQYWQNVYNTFFNYSGDYSGILRSGDFLGITMNYDDYDDWGFGDFVVNLFQNIIYTINSNQDTTINFGFLGDINSASFKINNSTINNFVGIFSNGLFLLMIIFFYYRLIKTIASLNIDKLAKYDFDSLFNLF